MSQQRPITQCPYCDTRFRITATQLEAAGGKARCSRCHKVFNARQYLQDSRVAHGRSGREPALETAMRPAPPPVPESPPPPADVPFDFQAAGIDTTHLDLELPSDATESAYPTHSGPEAGATPAPDFDAQFDLASADQDDLTIDSDAAAWDSLATGTDPVTPEPAEHELDLDFEGLTDELAASDQDAADDEITLTSEPWSGEPPEAFATPHTAGVEDDRAAPSDPAQAAVDTVAIPEPAGTESRAGAFSPKSPHGDPQDTATEALFADWGQGDEDERADPPSPAADHYADEEIAPLDTDSGLFDEPEPASPDTDPAEAQPAPVYGSALADELEATLTQRQRRLPTLLFGAGSLLLLALLVIQAGTTLRTELGQFPGLAPLAEWFCDDQECAGAAPRAPERIRIVNRDVRPHPQEAGALLISLSFVNEADFPQPYPTLEVSFSDIHDRRIALRRFQPSEYLRGKRRSSDPLPPGELVALSLSIVDPGERGVSFRFEFY